MTDSTFSESRQRRSSDGSFPSMRTCQSSVGSTWSDPVAIFFPSTFRTNATHLPSGARIGSESRPLEVSEIVAPDLSVNWTLPFLTETVWPKAGMAPTATAITRKSRFICLSTHADSGLESYFLERRRSAGVTNRRCGEALYGDRAPSLQLLFRRRRWSLFFSWLG